SIRYYQQLGFQQLAEAPLPVFSDGQVILCIDSDRFARAGIRLYAESWKHIVEAVQDLTKVHSTEQGYLLFSPAGCAIYLMETATPTQYNIAACQPAVVGNFAGLSLETGDIERSTRLWERLGFSSTVGSIEQGWITFTNADEFGVSLMQPNSCPHLFFNPSLTYFNGKNNLAIIAQIKKLEVPLIEEITVFNKEGIVDNVIIRDPGGLGFFIFSD
ncbi:MAG: hypothetical protein AAFO94_21165, partial [Bacteroidota bacterium]